MACQLWSEKLDTYLDGELPPSEETALREHLRSCAACSSDSLDRLQAKRAIKSAGQRFLPDAAFRARIQKSFRASRPAWRRWRGPGRTRTWSTRTASALSPDFFVPDDMPPPKGVSLEKRA